jgi:hypothetical protein
MNARRVFALVALALAIMALSIPQAAAQTIDQEMRPALRTSSDPFGGQPFGIDFLALPRNGCHQRIWGSIRVHFWA